MTEALALDASEEVQPLAVEELLNLVVQGEQLAGEGEHAHCNRHDPGRALYGGVVPFEERESARRRVEGYR